MLKEIQQELRTQDNRATRNPIFIVYDWRKVSSDSEMSNQWEYINPSNGDRIGDTKEDIMEYIQSIDSDECKPSNFEEMDVKELVSWAKEKGYEIEMWDYQEIKVFKGVFFTEKAANEFISQNKHNLTDKVYTYVDSLYGNPEMIYIRDCLLEGKFVEKSKSKMEQEPKNYSFVLMRDEEQLDITHLDEDDPKLAEELFYGEFGHKKQDGDKVERIDLE